MQNDPIQLHTLWLIFVDYTSTGNLEERMKSVIDGTTDSIRKSDICAHGNFYWHHKQTQQYRNIPGNCVIQGVKV